MKANELFPSKWLKKEDCEPPIVATIHGVTKEMIKGEGGSQLKGVLNFLGEIKPMVLNHGNFNRIAALYGDDTVNWPGKKIELYKDPMVEFGGKIIGGIRVRAPQGLPTQRPNGTSAQLLTYSDAIAACQASGISKEELVAMLKSKGLHGYNPTRDTQTVRDLIANRQAEQANQDMPFDEIPSASDSPPDDIPF